MKKLHAVFLKLLQSNRFLLLFSLITAFIVWVVVAMFVDPNTTVTIKNVPIDFESQSASLQRQGLNLINAEPLVVDVEVYGKSYVVGRMNPEEIKIQPRLTTVSGTGEQSLVLQWVAELGDEDYTVNLITPPTTAVKIDRLGSKTFVLEPHVTGVSIASGYIKETEVVTPERVTVTGPVNDLNRIAHAIVNVEMDKELSASETVSASILLVDSDGNAVESQYFQKDYETAQVSVPVLKVRDVPLRIDFINTPNGFPLAELSYTFSNETIKIAGPATLVDNYNEARLGHVDFKNLTIGTREVFDVELPSGFENVDNILSVSVEFQTDGFTSLILNSPGITLLNEPPNYTVRLLNPNLNQVEIIGPADVLETLTVEDIVAEIDLSEREVVTGQLKMPVKVYVPNKGVVWATGEYSALVEISE